ncbi:hypothetical protein OH540_21325 [Streptomyces sp. BPPL-273]|uniref:hypothetical protein n=1 Tax=Streptomyces sp. BPPL-273 TaxID=2987533 RepID=UPI0024AF7C15|nr:hypothetical protein [Streptomyces sp. BPPL-273]WHM32447.1 hypothetical protein OH540_21325 [Streptomyces sp. BPPL-273]
MALSALPGALTALLAILRAADGLHDVLVLDGPPVGDVSTAAFLAVGWSGGDEGAAEAQQDFNAAGARTRDEEFVITNVIDVWDGGEDFEALRAQAFEILGVVEQALRATEQAPQAPTLNGTVLWAHLTRMSLRQYFTDQGARVALGFTVSCHARI